MRHAILWASSTVMLTCAIAASAAPPQLKGRYAVTGSVACLVSPTGFNANLQPTDGKYFSHSNSVLAIRTYNGDGTGTVEGRQVTISPPPIVGMTFGPSASSSDFSFAFTYNVDANGIFTTAMVPGSFNGTFRTGPRGPHAGPPSITAQTYTVDKLSFTGLISGDKKIIDVATTVPEIETVTYSNGDVWQEICHRSRVHVFLGEN